MARPKSEATRIKDLETQVKYLELEKQKAEEEAHRNLQRALAMSSLFFDMYFLLLELQDNQDIFEDGNPGPYITALSLMAEKGTEL